MGFFPSMAPKYHLNHVTRQYPFMTCIVRVNTQSQWQRTVARVLDKCHGVNSFRMDDNGVVEISGTVDPSLLLKILGRAGRSAELCWFQFGECSSNLFMPTNPGGGGGGGGGTYSRDGRYLNAPNLSRPKLPSQPSINIQNYVFDHDNRHYNKHDYDHSHGHGYRHQQDYEYQSGYSRDGNQAQNPGCCRVM